MTGNNHDRTSALLTPLYAIAAAQYFSGTALLASILAYSFGWLFFSPDLDLPKSNSLRRWGALGFIWKLYDFTHKHRGRSHWPLFGSAERLAYLLLPLGVIAWFAFPAQIVAVQSNWSAIEPLALAGYAGVEVACLWHLCCDWLPGLNKL